MIDSPHFGFPFTRGSFVEQDSDREVTDCVEVLLSTELGERIDIPEYGLPNPTFEMGGADADSILDAIHRWEPRAATTIEDNILDGYVQTIVLGLGADE